MPLREINSQSWTSCKRRTCNWAWRKRTRARRLREQFFAAVLEIEKLYKKSQQTELKLMKAPRNMKPKQLRKLRFEYARQMVLISRAIRCIGFSTRFRRSLSDGLRKVVGQVKPLEQEIARLQRQIEQAVAQERRWRGGSAKRIESA